MGYLFGAFEKIAAPDLAANGSQISREGLEEAKWDKELHRPNRRFRNLFLNEGRKRAAGLNLFADFAGKFCKLFEAVRRGFGVYDVRTEKSATAIELEIEVAAIWFWLRKKLDATVFPNFIEIFRPDTADVAIMHLKNAVYPVLGIQQLRKRPGPVTAALRAKVGYFKRLGCRPGWVVPDRAQGQPSQRLSN